MKPKKISIQKIADVFCLFASDIGEYDIWGTHVTENDVMECIKSEIFEETPYFVAQQNGIEYNQYNHAARIAFLVINKDKNPIEIDVGAPSLGDYTCNILDGNHRTAAAIIRGDENILAHVSGEVSYIRHLFVRPMKKYSML